MVIEFKRRNPLWKRSQVLAPYLFTAPFVLLFLVFMAYPFIFMIFLSFTNWSGFGDKAFIGLSNYSYLLKDKIFWQTIENGFVIFLMYVPIMLFMALVLAMVLNQKSTKLKSVFRTVIYLPNITNVVAVSFVFLLLFTGDGLINSFLVKLGFEKINLLATPFGARSIISGLVLWRWLGYNMILMLAGLQNIPNDLYEAAYIDGATKIQSFTKITIPLMRPIIIFASILSTSGSFGLIAEPMLITEGNPGHTTLSTILYLYNESFQGFNFGYAAAIGIGYFIFMFILSILQLKISNSKK